MNCALPFIRHRILSLATLQQTVTVGKLESNTNAVMRTCAYYGHQKINSGYFIFRPNERKLAEQFNDTRGFSFCKREHFYV